MFMDRILASKPMQLTLALFASLLFIAVFNPTKASAAYEAGRLIDDVVLLDARSMDIGQIQNFLNNRGGQIANKQFVMDCDLAGQQSKQLYVSAGAPCESTTSAATIIYYSAQIYGISPKVIMATMQKEQSLITATNPTDRQYAQAMGYACPTSGNCSDSSNFFWQIDNGTWVLRFHFERARGNMSWWYNSSSWVCGVEKAYYKPNLYPRQNVNFYDTNGTHYATIYIQNAATSSLYCYTPHAYNNPQGLYGRAPYGTTGLYYSGSYNFVTAFDQWFGTTLEPEIYVSSGLSLSTNNPVIGQEVTASFQISNKSNVPVSIGHMIVAVRDPVGRNNDFSLDTNVTIPANGVYTYSRSRPFSIPGNYTMFISNYHGSSWYTDFPLSLDASIVRQRTLQIKNQ